MSQSTTTGGRNPLGAVARFFTTATTRGRTRIAKIRLALARLFVPAVTVWPFVAGTIAAYTADADKPFNDGIAAGVAFYTDHLTYALAPLASFAISCGYTLSNYRRTHPPTSRTGKPLRPAQPALPPLSQARRDAADIVANHDHLVVRLLLWAVLAAAVLVPAHFLPIGLSDVTGRDDWADPEFLRPLLISAATPVLAAALVCLRTSHVIAMRRESVDEIYAVARDTLGYPKAPPRTNPTKRQITLATPWKAIEVKDWRGLYEPNEFFVHVPEELSVEDVVKWGDFETNLNAKVPRAEEWRITRDARGRGATVGPANYPTAVLWDGEYDPDPLTFLLGVNLENGKTQRLTFNDASPHMAVSGGTSSGKTSLAEIIAAQNLIKPMPWDPNLHGMVVIIDPKGPFARRWAGRPGVVVANGQEDAAEPDDEGNIVTGPMVMAACMQWVEEEHQRRAKVLARYPNVATWMHLDDEVKAKERFFPILVILDEYLDHTDLEKANGDERVEKENYARQVTTRLAAWHARKYRNVGMHTSLIGQEVKMTAIGSNLMRNLPVRAITGQMDPTQMETMFGTREVPPLPATRVVYENGERYVKTIPGRARIMNALGQQIHKIQVMWFGGKTNSDTLDKWLPRGEVPPNGDFSLPKGLPRTPDDFDEHCNLKPGHEAPPMRAADVEDPMSGAHASTMAPVDLDAARDPDDESTSTPALGRPLPPIPPPPSDSADPVTIFPAADAATSECGLDGCPNDAVLPCDTCDRVVCAYHQVAHPDPGNTARICSTCHDEHPLETSGAGAIYRRTWSLARDAGLVCTVTVRTPTSIVATVRNPVGQKVLELHAVDGNLSVQSRSGKVEGAAVPARIEAIIDAFQQDIDRRRAAAAAAGE